MIHLGYGCLSMSRAKASLSPLLTALMGEATGELVLALDDATAIPNNPTASPESPKSSALGRPGHSALPA